MSKKVKNIDSIEDTETINKPKKFKIIKKKVAISLFSGAGGDTLGLIRSNYLVKGFSEFNKFAIETHINAFKDSELIMSETKDTNIKNIPDSVFEDLKKKYKIDLVFAGFPCQGFSNAGKKKENDPRNELVYEFVRAVDILKPKWIIGENVRGLLSRKGVNPKDKIKMPIINIIQSIFDDIGYTITWNVVSALDYNLPQERKRLIIIGHRKDLLESNEFIYPHFNWEQSFLKTKKEQLPTIRHILENTLEGAIEFPKTNIPSDLDPNIWIKTTLENPPEKNTIHPNLIRLVNGIRNKSTKEINEETGGDASKLTEKTIIVPNGLISFNKRASGYHGQICHPDSPSKTIICTYATCPRLFVGLYNEKIDKYWIRTFTITELAQIQGFPSDFPFCGARKDIITQIGNAVPPPIIQSITNLLDTVTFQKTPQSIFNQLEDNNEEDDEDNEE